MSIIITMCHMIFMHVELLIVFVNVFNSKNVKDLLAFVFKNIFLFFLIYINIVLSCIDCFVVDVIYFV